MSVLTPAQLAQWTLSSEASNGTDQIDRVFDRLEEGNALENVDEFLTQLAENAEVGYSGHQERDNPWLLNIHTWHLDMYPDLRMSCGGSIGTETFATVYLASCMVHLQHSDRVVFKSSHVVIQKVPDLQPVARDRVMNRTFAVLSPHLASFTQKDWSDWFEGTLEPALPSFNPMMLKNATSNINCTNYRVV